jgi:thymidylate synthase (FAD)
MKVVSQQVDILPGLTESKVIENFGKILNVPYSKDMYNEERTKHAIKACVLKGHLSVLEHVSATLLCTTNIGTYKDFTRHRHCAFTIESTSFTKYNELQVILTDDKDKQSYETLLLDEQAYRYLLKEHGPKVARDLLPQATTAKMIMTTNFREWRWIISLRGDPNDNPLTNELRDKMWTVLNQQYPFFFPLPPVESEESDLCPMTLYDAWGKHKVARFTYTYERNKVL